MLIEYEHKVFNFCLYIYFSFAGKYSPLIPDFLLRINNLTVSYKALVGRI